MKLPSSWKITRSGPFTVNVFDAPVRSLVTCCTSLPVISSWPLRKVCRRLLLAVATTRTGYGQTVPAEPWAIVSPAGRRCNGAAMTLQF